MSGPTPEQFPEFYREVYGWEPFPVQQRLAQRVSRGDWPRAIALPTAAGKTACLDVAVFALACQAPRAPRRLFFVVDRRLVVDQAWEHAVRLAQVLDRAPAGILRRCADRLRALAEPDWLQVPAADRQRILERRWAIQRECAGKRQQLLEQLTAQERFWYALSPLNVFALRGGIYRESAWARSPLQPTVITSTVAQVGSRLLFRGYGVSDAMKPIHAGLVGNDALLLLDEAHCARPFAQTLQAVTNYRDWTTAANPPFWFVSMTATPSAADAADDIFRADARDHADPVLGKRLAASKPATLVVADQARGKRGTLELVKVLEKQARALAEQQACVGILVNRVKTARALHQRLGSAAVLLTGRMRPLDRARLFEERLKPLLTSASGPLPRFVIATQCLECGADLDLHALVSECASLDALQQRFGRLNRGARRATAPAVIVLRGEQLQAQPKAGAGDPIYGSSLLATWQWLNEHADGTTGAGLPWIDFGVTSIYRKLEETPAGARAAVLAPASNAPVLFPAHLDSWVQTNPLPQPDPDPDLFLHGHHEPRQPDVQVVVRADLGDDREQWADIVALCPPSAAEALPVPISVFRQWLAGAAGDFDEASDVEGDPSAPAEAGPGAGNRWALEWQGPEGLPIAEPRQVRPNAVYVLPCAAPELASLGDFLDQPPADIAHEAFQFARDRAILHLPALVLPEDSAQVEPERVNDALQALAAPFTDASPGWLRRAVQALQGDRTRSVAPHPLGGVVLTGSTRLHRFDPTYLDDSEPAESFRGRAVGLKEHAAGVAAYARRFARGCGLDAEVYEQAGLWHDLGKLDPRFQALLKQSSPRTAVGEPLARSARVPASRREGAEARAVHRYPAGARHELLSAALVATQTDDDLLLHLIATHHGCGRPFAAPVAENDAAPAPFTTPLLFGQAFTLPTAAQQSAAWNAELPERFWRVVRRFGWWGAAYREAVFRLADHSQSRQEQEQQTRLEAVSARPLARSAPLRNSYGMPLAGLDGANPLGFLAALGTLVVTAELALAASPPAWLAGGVAPSWGSPASAYAPVLHFAAAPPAPAALVACLAAHLPRSEADHPGRQVFAMLADAQGSLDEQICAWRRCHPPGSRPGLDWVTALTCEAGAAGASQLQTVRSDYLLGNLRSILERTTAEHLRRALLEPWDYADALDNQSLHWEPGEDRRHAYQWYVPSTYPTRKRRGGMLGANRLALEAWPLFPSFPAGERVATRGFRGNRVSDTFLTWPLWQQPLTRDAVASLLGLSALQQETVDPLTCRHYGIAAVFRVQRVLVGKTPNFTNALALA